MTGPVGALGGLLNAALLRNGAITRNLGDAVAFCPPLITSEEQVDDLFAIVKKSLDDVTRLVKEN
ncbi:hypothetical protein ACSQ8I_04185 [Marinovum sp. E06]|uniref:hypothetical protein n=1 Tax=Marinovum sp. E06 TaxID=3449225 RepID=UPI003EDBE121